MQTCLGDGGETRRRVPAQQAAGSLPWIGVEDPSDEQRLQADHATGVQEPANFQLRGPERLTRAHDPKHALQKNGGVADQWYMDEGDIMSHPTMVPFFLQEFDVANTKVGAERNLHKTEVIDLDAAPIEWRIRDAQNMAKLSTVAAGIITLGALLPLGSTSRTNSWPRQTSFEQCTNASSSARTRRRNLPSSVRVWELVASTTSCEYTASQSWKNSGLQKSSSRLGSVLLNGSSRSWRTA